jgi:hypothetical protein
MNNKEILKLTKKISKMSPTVLQKLAFSGDPKYTQLYLDELNTRYIKTIEKGILNYLQNDLGFGNQLNKKPSAKNTGFKNSADIINFYVNYAVLNKRPTGINIEELNTIVNDTYAYNSIISFNIRLMSSANDGIILLDKDFRNLYHFRYFIKQLLAGVNDYNPSGDDTISGMSVVNDLFTYSISPIAGGNSTTTTKKKYNKENRKATKKIYGFHFDYTVKSIRVINNNCALECLRDLLKSSVTCKQMRDSVGSIAKTLVSVEDLMTIFHNFNTDLTKTLAVYTKASDVISDDENVYKILFEANHYHIIKSVLAKNMNTDKNVKRGILVWDIETVKLSPDKYVMIGKDTVATKTSKATKAIKSYYIEGAILHACYKFHKFAKLQYIKFTTDKSKTCCRKFLDWLIIQNKAGKYFHSYAHNGGNFDLYFLTKEFTKQETEDYKPLMRGKTIIKLAYGKNIFKDTYCFMPQSLANLSKNYKINTPKLKSFMVNGKILTSEEICFYRADLFMEDFLNLEFTDPEYWECYNEYCKVDCISLMEIWDKFNDNCNTLIEKYVQAVPWAVKELRFKCGINSASTIGGHAIKILNTLQQGEISFKQYKMFINDVEKHNYLMKNFKRGGISQCNQKGKHTKGVASVDICSQYSSSMVNMEIPTGLSNWVKTYDKDVYGYYHIKNLVFDEAKTFDFKPVCGKLESGVLNWNTGNNIDDLYITSYDIKYLQENYGLVSFDTIEGLVSNYSTKGRKIFGHYVWILFEEKAEQDEYKNNNNPLYNPSYRETIKLYLNAVTGKLVMDKSKYDSIEFTSDYDYEMRCENPTKRIELLKKHRHTENVYEIPIIKHHVKLDNKTQAIRLVDVFTDNFDATDEEILKNPWIYEKIITKDINNCKFSNRSKKEEDDSQFNLWINAGCMVYSYSKRLLFEYIKLLPNNSNDVIHVETDSIYFSRDILPNFTKAVDSYEGDYPIAFGNNLGNIKIEKNTTDVCYFLGKKTYYIAGNCIWKGIPKFTLSNDGVKTENLSVDIYDTIFKHKIGDKPVEIEYMTLNKNLFGTTYVSCHRQTRMMNSTYDYKLY